MPGSGACWQVCSWVVCEGGARFAEGGGCASSFRVRRWKLKQRDLCFPEVISERFFCVSQNRYFPPASLDCSNLGAALVLCYLACPTLSSAVAPRPCWPISAACPWLVGCAGKGRNASRENATQLLFCFHPSHFILADRRLSSVMRIGQLADKPWLPLLMDWKLRWLSLSPSNISGSSPFCQRKQNYAFDKDTNFWVC